MSCYDGKSFINFNEYNGLANNFVYSIIEDKTGNLWFGTASGGVSRYDGKAFVNFIRTEETAFITVWDIMENRNENILFGTYGFGILSYDELFFKKIVPFGTIWSIIEDKPGNLWMGTDRFGVLKFDGKLFTQIDINQGLASNNVRCAIVDRNGNLWFGTEGGGVSFYNGNSFVNYSSDQGLISNNVRCIAEDQNGNIWFGTKESGVSRFNGKTFLNFSTKEGLPNNFIASIVVDKKGNIWFGTAGGGASRFDGKSFINITTNEGLPDDNVMSVVINKQDNIVFGTNLGIGLLKYFTRHKTEPNFHFGNNDRSPDIDPNLIVREDRNNHSSLGYVYQIPAQNNLSNDEIINYRPLIEIYNQATGYPINDVNGGSNNGAMLCDSKGIIWAGTGSDKTALVRFDPAALNRNPEPPTVIIQSIRINEESICWYCLPPAPSKGGGEKNLRSSAQSAGDTTNGNRITTELQPNDSAAFLLAQFFAFGKPVPQAILDSQRTRFGDIKFDGITKFYPLPENLVLPYNHNHITFEYAAIEPARPYLVKYQYALVKTPLWGDMGGDEWSPITGKTDVVFGNLWEGTYTFKLKAQGPDGGGYTKWSEPAVYTFTVLPPWYRHWLAYLFYMLLLVSCIWLLVWWNGRRLIALARELKRRVDEATKEIRKQKEAVEEAHKNLTDSIDYARRIQDAMLPFESRITETLTGLGTLSGLKPDFFIFYRPRDVVSGDFYWFMEKEGKAVIAAVDCTGHGVPGAFMSMIGNDLLNDIVGVRSITRPDLILIELHKGIVNALRQDETGNDDGMDIALATIDFEKQLLHYSGAKNPLVYVQNGLLHEIKADKLTIGGSGKDEPDRKFTLQEVKLLLPTLFYLFTDGFQDQLGGVKGKKIMMKRMQETLYKIHGRPMKEQRELLDEEFEKWKGDFFQVDDVLVIGVRL